MATDKVQGVYYGAGDGTGIRYMSNTTGYVVDLLCEGEISGLVHEEYKDNGSNVAGSIGYTQGMTHKPYHSSINTGELASIYWNKNPVFDKDSFKFNLQSIDLVTNQETISQEGLDSRRLVQINEKLRGKERKTGGATIEFAKYERYYVIRNKYCNKAIVNFKISSLGKVDRNPGTTAEPNETYGKLLDASVAVNISYRAKYALGSDVQYTSVGSMQVEGSLSSPYSRSFIIDLPLVAARDKDGRGDFIGWEIQIFKETEEPTTPDVKNDIFVDNIVEEIDDTFIYPKSYVVKNTFDAENFSKIPDRAYDMNLLKVKIPSNYDPISRTYHGTWDGTFSTESVGPYGKKDDTYVGASRGKGLYWTDNPAWCFYDLITNKRYGLGKYVDTSTLDKWTLYEIGQYCDELVQDYDNGLEPRFSCNILIQSRSDAYQVLNDMASIFRGIVYYNGGALFAVQDALKNPIFQFNNTNVQNGEFKYSSTSAKVRHTVAIVRYNDKNNKFEPAVEYVEDIDSIRKYGIKEKEISAFGCTSKSQAQRLGRWILSTEANETETVSFSAGQEGSILRPGDVFTVSDTNRSMTRRGGRIKGLDRVSDSIFKITLDAKLKGGKSWDGNKFITNDNLDQKREYQLKVSTPSFYYDTSQVSLNNSSEIDLIRNKQIQTFDISSNTIASVSGVSVITVSGNLNETSYTTSGFSGEALWSIATTGVDNRADTFFESLTQEQEFRVINIGERDKGKYEISAAEYARRKYAEIDEATKPVNNINFAVPGAPAGIGVPSLTSIAGAPNTKKVSFNFSASTVNSESVSYYQVYIRKGASASEATYDSSVKVFSLNNLTASFIPATNGEYYISVYAYNSLGQSNGVNVSQSKTVGGVNPIRDVKISHLSLHDDAVSAAGQNPNESDPTTAGTVDQYEDSTVRFKWATSIPQVDDANIALDFSYQLRVWAEHTTAGTPIKTTNQYKPDDSDSTLTTYDWTLADNYAAAGNSYDNIKRKVTLKVVAQTPEGASSDGQQDGMDFLFVDNPAPTQASALQGFVDLNNHLKIFNLNRPSDVKEVVVLSRSSTFSYSDYQGGAGGIDMQRISADVDVIEINPSWSTQNTETQDAYFMVAYVDQFDLDVEKLAVSNGDSYDLTKKLTGRFSDVKGIEKVTQDTMDLLGEGWKAWIQIDVQGNWYGRGIACVEDVTDEYSNYEGYLPFYCTFKSPTIYMTEITAAVGTMVVGPTNALNNYSMGCGYYWKQGDLLTNNYPSNTATRDISPKGGYSDSSTDASDNFTHTDSKSYTKGFRRYRVHFKKAKDDPYWVVGMNSNNESYYSNTFLEGIDAFFSPTSAIQPSYASDFKAGAQAAMDAAIATSGPYAGKDLQIGGSDAYFNFHPAGFVQGFGGLPKLPCYFDVHMGKLVDNSYLSNAIFFVMATTEETNDQKNTSLPQCAGNTPAGC